ncbi:flagellar hook-length control protein FliK [Halopseudomonas sp.]|uniref:flagellar hook-length control protein FliK n=1 Tax=Halopseudomonas sp. TaxID=2901191 RepID=UPI0039E6AAD5
MSVSQNMQAILSSPVRQSVSSAGPASSAQSSEGEGAQSFSAVLSGQQSEQLDALLAFLEGPDGGAGLAALEELEIAVDGKDLPADMEGWLEQLAELSLNAGSIATDAETDPALLKSMADDWAQWLTQARQALNDAAELEGESNLEGELDSELLALNALPGRQAGVGDARAAAAVAGMQGVTASGAQGTLTADQLQQAQLERELRQESATGSSKADRVSLLETQIQQRAQDPSLAGQDTRAAFTAKLSDALEALTGKRGSAETDATEALQRSGTQGQATAQGTLAARPVLAATQSLGVPFGQAGWGDAVLEKMQWMSSQNLRSVEIRLDPAELGPLEIHIQTRGQEHQVQFVSQNPSVREALEAQMFRLRESFSQQGMDLVNVSVGDSSVGQQAGQDSQGRPAGESVAGAPSTASMADEAGMLMAVDAISQAMTNRLVDYYA